MKIYIEVYSEIVEYRRKRKILKIVIEKSLFIMEC